MWCSINLGIVFCTECSGIHRGLGAHVSKVRSLDLDFIEQECLEVLLSTGNRIMNDSLREIMEVLDIPSIHSKSTPAERDRYIRAKYLEI